MKKRSPFWALTRSGNVSWDFKASFLESATGGFITVEEGCCWVLTSPPFSSSSSSLSKILERRSIHGISRVRVVPQSFKDTFAPATHNRSCQLVRDYFWRFLLEFLSLLRLSLELSNYLYKALTLIRHCVVFFDLAPLVALVALKWVPPQKLQAFPQLLVLVSC